MYLLTQNKNCISALSLKRHLGVCYRCAWRVKHNFREAIAEREDPRQLSGVVVADDANLGGVRAGKRGRGSANKVVFIAAVELDDDGHPQHVRFDPLPDLKATSEVTWARHARDPATHLFTDGLTSLAVAATVVANSGAITVSPRTSSDLDAFRWVNTIIGNLKTAIRELTTISASGGTRAAPSPRHNIGSAAASTCLRCYRAFRTLVREPPRARKPGCVLR